MKRTFAEAMAHRRSYYSIGSDSPVLDEEIVAQLQISVTYFCSIGLYFLV